MSSLTSRQPQLPEPLRLRQEDAVGDEAPLELLEVHVPRRHLVEGRDRRRRADGLPEDHHRGPRADADWGWRVIGNPLLLFGSEGEDALNGMMAQRNDRRLADLAWRVLYPRQQAMSFTPVTEQEDAQAHAHRP